MLVGAPALPPHRRRAGLPWTGHPALLPGRLPVRPPSSAARIASRSTAGRYCGSNAARASGQAASTWATAAACSRDTSAQYLPRKAPCDRECDGQPEHPAARHQEHDQRVTPWSRSRKFCADLCPGSRIPDDEGPGRRAPWHACDRHLATGPSHLERRTRAGTVLNHHGIGAAGDRSPHLRGACPSSPVVRTCGIQCLAFTFVRPLRDEVDQRLRGPGIGHGHESACTLSRIDDQTR